MRYLQSLAIAIPLAAVMAFAQEPSPDPSSSQSQSQTQKSKSKTSTQTERRAGQADVGTTHTYTGHIVDANCSQASSLMPSSSATTTSSSSESKTKSNASAKKDVLRHCQPTSSTTAFAIITDDGSFYKLDDMGNSKVTSDLGGPKKNMKVTVNGSVESDTLKVQSISKM